MKTPHRRLAVLLLLIASFATAQTAPHTQLWVGTADYHAQHIPVRLELTTPAGDGRVTGTLVNGHERATSSSGEERDGELHLRFDYFARRIDAHMTAGELRGTYFGARMKQPIDLLLFPVGDETASAKSAPVLPGPVESIDGDWEIAVNSPKGESAWTLHVAPDGHRGEIEATIQRIDGDTGGLYGTYDSAAGDYQVSRFSASGPALYALHPNADGTLGVRNLLTENAAWTARRVAQARSEHLAPPTRTTDQTGIIDPSRPLAFTGTDLAGNTVSNADPRFRGKVVLAAVGGSWCPNCHDEAPLLVELYRRFHNQGLEVVDLSFEEEDQLHNPERLRAFVSRYQIPYTVLLMGTPDQLNEKLPQGKNLNSWPTSFFIGRDGLVKEVHAGFSGPATGQAYTDLRAETIALVQQLLSQPAPPAR